MLVDAGITEYVDVRSSVQRQVLVHQSPAGIVVLPGQAAYQRVCLDARCPHSYRRRQPLLSGLHASSVRFPYRRVQPHIDAEPPEFF
jgi:hypothetical protein